MGKKINLKIGTAANISLPVIWPCIIAKRIGQARDYVPIHCVYFDSLRQVVVHVAGKKTWCFR